MDPAIHSLLTGASNAWLATLMPDGAPHLTPIWIDVEDEDIVFSTTLDTLKAINMELDPRVAIAIESPDDRYRVVTIRGHVVALDGSGATELVDRLSQRHDGHAWEGKESEPDRVMARVRPDRITLLQD